MIYIRITYDKVVIVGAGKFGCEVNNLLKMKNINISCFMDNYKNDTILEEINVWGLTKRSKKVGEICYLICVKDKEIQEILKNQLLKLYVDEKDIIVFDDLLNDKKIIINNLYEQIHFDKWHLFILRKDHMQ